MHKTKTRFHSTKIVVVALLLIAGVLLNFVANAEQLTSRSIQIADARPAVSTEYRMQFTRPNANIIGSIELEICSNDPFPGLPCTAPNGFSFNASNIINQIGVTGFIKHPTSTSNKFIFSRTPSLENAGILSVTLGSVVNPNQAGGYFARIRTFASDDATGASTDQGGLAISINPPFNVSTEVPPKLYFCVGVTIPGYDCLNAIGNYVDFGELLSTQANARTSQFVIATNADFGYVVYINGTQPTSGNNIIPALSILTPSNPNTGQYGINLRANNNPVIGQDPVGPTAWAITADYNVINRYKFVSGNAIVLNNTTSNYMKYTVSYIINVNRNQPPGFYTSTLIYVATATF
jgi:hypothetical protein